MPSGFYDTLSPFACHERRFHQTLFTMLTLFNRLEAATSRLEDMVTVVGEDSAAPNGLPSAQPQRLTLDDDHARGLSPPAQQPIETLPPAIDDFDKMIENDVKTYVNMSEEIGGLVAEQVSEHARTQNVYRD